MTLTEEIQAIVSSMTDNNHPPSIVKITKGYETKLCDIIVKDSRLQHIRCSGYATPNTTGLLIYEDGDQSKPYVVLLHENPYPIGAIYQSTIDTDPSTLFGGEWEEITGQTFNTYQRIK